MLETRASRLRAMWINKLRAKRVLRGGSSSLLQLGFCMRIKPSCPKASITYHEITSIWCIQKDTGSLLGGMRKIVIQIIFLFSGSDEEPCLRTAAGLFWWVVCINTIADAGKSLFTDHSPFLSLFFDSWQHARKGKLMPAWFFFLSNG